MKDSNFGLQIVVLIIAKTIFLWCSVSLGLSAVIIIAGEVGSILSFYQLFLYQSQIDTFPTWVNFPSIVIYIKAKHVEAFEPHIL